MVSPSGFEMAVPRGNSTIIVALSVRVSRDERSLFMDAAEGTADLASGQESKWSSVVENKGQR